MTYKEALNYLFSQLPMFHRIGAAAYKANLDNTLALSKATGFAHNQFKSIHVAGTNGKGSVSHMLASTCQEAGLKTGLFTSPHLVDFRERMKINGQMIPEAYVVDFIEKYATDLERIKPSFFEMTFVMAMCWFKESKIDIAIIETGLGGRIDSTNVITPVLSIITNIGYDHIQFLGSTLPSIAAEKAGIIKQGVPVVIGESHPETDMVFIQKAESLNAKIIFADQIFSSRPLEINAQNCKKFEITDKASLTKIDIESPLVGDYQQKNIVTVLASTLLTSGFPFTDGQMDVTTVKKGIRNTIKNTGLLGRWQVIGKNPLIICDIGHNTHSVPLIVEQIRRTRYKKLHFVIGVVNDKDITGMLQMLPLNAEYYFCKADIPRGLAVEELQQKATESGLKGKAYNSVAEAFEAAKKNADIKDMIFVGGSAFTVAEVLAV
ncbi:MAG TPA: folylpolyglutamate synthase/dihydrofolate synthase family protein [Lentimicrobium sp.]|nr:folylpolyglutamate synthase/dihydrofolate synthase family protein [Lentimicrobium sp.]